MADPLRDKIAALVNATTIRPIDLPDKIAAIVRAHATNDAAVERAAMTRDVVESGNVEAVWAAMLAAAREG